MDIKSITVGLIGLLVGAGIVVGTVIVTKPVPASPQLGAFTPESTDHICVGGACTYTYKQAIIASSSMLCNIPFPNAGTSSVTYAGIQIQGNGLGSQTFDISTSSNAYGTSSLPFVWKKSTGTGQSSTAWEPGATSSPQLSGVNALTGELNTLGTSTDYLNFKVATGTPGAFSAGYDTGTCVASFRVLQ